MIYKKKQKKTTLIQLCDERLNLVATNRRTKRAQETPQEKEQRLLSEATHKSKKRKNETTEEHENRNDNESSPKQNKRAQNKCKLNKR